MNKKDIERIEQFLMNDLSESDRIAFESRLEQDEDLAAEFDRHETAHKVLDFVIAKNLKADLMELEAESKVVSLQSRKRRSLRVVLSAAASVLLLVGFFALNFLNPGNVSPSELAFENYQLRDPAGVRSAGDKAGYPESLEKGLDALDQEDYQTASELLGSVGSEDDYYILAQFYLGHSLYLNKSYADAAVAFQNVAASEDLRYQAEAEWYTLLSCMAQDQVCTAELEKITSDTGHDYYEDASEISKKLSK